MRKKGKKLRIRIERIEIRKIKSRLTEMIELKKSSGMRKFRWLKKEQGKCGMTDELLGWIMKWQKLELSPNHRISRQTTKR
jgi:hypothetical protein